LARRYFHPQEYSHLAELTEIERVRLFFQLWTAKEAICKFNGGVLWSYLGVNVLPQVIDMSTDSDDHFKGLNVYPVLRFKGFSFTVASKKGFKNCVINRMG